MNIPKSFKIGHIEIMTDNLDENVIFWLVKEAIETRVSKAQRKVNQAERRFYKEKARFDDTIARINAGIFEIK